MKRTVSIILMGFLAFQSAGYFIFFRVLQETIRSEVRAGMADDPESSGLVELVVPNDPALASSMGYRMIHDHEIVYRSVYYDIVAASEEGGSTRYYCHRDERETRLVNKMAETDRCGKGSDMVVRLLSLTFYHYVGTFADTGAYLPGKPSGIPDLYSFSEKTWTLLVHGPPPKLIV